MEAAVLEAVEPSGAAALPDFTFSPSPWISGTKFVAFYGPVSAQVEFERDYAAAEDLVLDLIKARALEISGDHCNAVVGIDVSVDPFAEGGMVLRVVCTAACIELLSW